MKGLIRVAVRPTRLAVIACAAFAMASVAAIAHADPASSSSTLFSQHDDFTPHTNQMGPQPPHRTLQWDTKTGRWGVNLDMAQPSDRDVQGRDVHIGVNYRVAPNVRTGVGFALGPETTPDGRRPDAEGPAPRVRLETTFKF
jgi:hypothetical protein